MEMEFWVADEERSGVCSTSQRSPLISGVHGLPLDGVTTLTTAELWFHGSNALHRDLGIDPTIKFYYHIFKEQLMKWKYNLYFNVK